MSHCGSSSWCALEFQPCPPELDHVPVRQPGPGQSRAIDSHAIAVLAAQVGDDELLVPGALDDRVMAMHGRIRQPDVIVLMPPDADAAASRAMLTAAG